MRVFMVVIAVIVAVSFAGTAVADTYVTVHRPGLGEAVGGMVVGVAMLPVNIVGGIAKGIAGYDETVLVRDSARPVQQAVYYYNEPVYAAPPFNPGYQYNYWYPQSTGIVFVSGGSHRFHAYNHGGQYNGHQIRNHKQRKGERR